MTGLLKVTLLDQPAASSPATPIHLKPLTTLCTECRVSGLCLPTGLPVHDNSCLGALIGPRMRIRKGAALFNANDPLTTLYAVRCGSFKTSLNSAEGQGVVINFWMPGDVLGLDAIATEHHVCDAIALEDSEVCPVPYRRLQALARDFPVLQQSLNRLMSREIVREHERVLMLCNLTAEQRLASFLVGLSQRFVSRGYSAHGFMLRMSREDMASYLGLRLETVCRSVARMRALGIVSMRGRLVEILDLPALIALEQGGAEVSPKDTPKAPCSTR
ncbi:Crp/Fnr family transcriptional regulator [Pseudomonas plecoglossicida]|jgi:CRP/FNR family transcriptional regulator|uniref:Crp/Fnr family transcriptional regulator n=4 Tax=Pseudomonas putida group TaxID=136845 RepID=A0ABX4TYK4_PSEDL|nr:MULTISPECIES: helix-turn-helix domain-containing protein [Pseudomonas]TXI05805.1 MAG: cyclic nucleotide-binding domain-containing protein [Pseudomonas monteilii]CAB5605091.1 Fumarate and nitrate reduction regulatory protein [Pseudomonas putida]GJB78597.1 Crp/Fnr family transcriptional regulator [Aeromonas caviae]AGA73289.1 CRP/FNR family transcriptional regulator [Pseudomonas putida HB3267]KYC16873.1 Crp/Fnr family transcriptional regulator [Pseudomonas sp. ABFPK]